MNPLLKGLRETLRDLQKDIEKHTGKEVSLFLFGSYARGDFHAESDIDILILVPEDWSQPDRAKAMEVITRYNNLYHTLITPIFVNKKGLEESNLRPLIAIDGEDNREEKERFSKKSKLEYADMHLSKAERHLQRAKKLLSLGIYPPAVHEAYYAVFHSSKAYLFLLGEDPQTHKGVRQLMNLYLFKEKDYYELSKIYDYAIHMRQRADYDVFGDFIEEEEARELLDKAELYIKRLKGLVEDIKSKL